MPVTSQNVPKLPTLVCFAFSIFTRPACADAIADRLDAIEHRLTRIEMVVQVPPTTRPATQPATQPAPAAVPVRADTFAAARAAILNGSKWIQTTGIEVAADLDARGALIELLPGGPNWKPAISLTGDAMLLNATLKTPPSTFNAAGQRTGFYKALTAMGRSMSLKNVTIAPDAGFCIHVQQGRLAMENVKATTFSEYFVFQNDGTFTSARNCEVKGGSRAESVWRVAGANYLIEDCILDNSQGGKAVLRGDSPGDETTPGGIVRRTRIVGQIGPNPLTEDDGGQMFGIDRWRLAEGGVYQLDYTRKPETIAFARQMYLNGATAEQIVRAAADKFIDAQQLAKVVKGKTRLSDADIKLTLDYRAKEVGRQSRFLIEDCEIISDLRLNARATGTIRNTSITSSETTTPLSGNSQPTYPYPTDRVIVGGEQKPPPDVTFDHVEIKGGPSIGIDLKAWPSLKFLNGSTYRENVISAESRVPIFNSTGVEIAGTTRITTVGGLTYPTPFGEASAWVGGYDGPGGTDARPADWSRRWRDYDESKLRAFARSLKSPIVVIDIEHWEVDPVKDGEETARTWLNKLAALCRTIKQERPDIVVGCYDILPASNYWALVNWGAWQRWKETGQKNNELPDAWWAAKEQEYRNDFAAWQQTNDFTKSILLPAVDALFPSIYPNYRIGEAPRPGSIPGSLEMDGDVVRLKIEESKRIAEGKPVYPYYWPIIKEDGGEIADAARTSHTIDTAIAAGASGIVIWSDVRPREVIEQTFQAAREVSTTRRAAE